MSSYYSVVRYVPDPIADERINVGVIVYGEGQLKTRFLRRWIRVKGFGAEDTSFLRDFSREVENAQRELFGLPQPWNEETLKKVSSRWRNSIQISEPRASLKAPEALLDEVAAVFLRESPPPRSRARDKRAAVSLGLQGVEAAIRGKGIDPSNLIKRKETIRGRLDEHVFDFVVGNGRPLFAAEGLSFEGIDADTIQSEINALAWAVDDVRKVSRSLPVNILALPPRSQTAAAYRRAEKLFTSLRATFVPEASMAKWAQLMARRVH